MDPEIKKELLRQKAARIELVKKEMAWEAAKHDLSLRKLQSRYDNRPMLRLGLLWKKFLVGSDVFTTSLFAILYASDVAHAASI
jgi:hypothetical protein